MTGVFPYPLHVEVTDGEREGRKLCTLLAPFTYVIDETDSITVPKGFATDFASIPRAFWRFEPPLGRSAKAAVVHDWIYFSKSRPRAEADKLFREALADCGVPAWKRQAMWAAVRLGGGKGYGS